MSPDVQINTGFQTASKKANWNPRLLYLFALYPLLATAPVLPISDRFGSFARVAYVFLSSLVAALLILFVLTPGLRNARQWLERYSTRIVLGTAALYTMAFVFLAYWVRVRNGMGTTVDLGLFEQTLWAGSQGQFFYSTFYGSFLAAHFAPILVPLSLIYKAIPNIGAIFAVQIGLLAGAAVLLYALLKDDVGKLPALFISLAFMLSPAVLSQHFTLYLNHFAPFFWMGAALAFWRKNLVAFMLFSVLAASVQEDVAFSLVVFALLAWFGRRSLSWRLLTLLFPLAWFGMGMAVIQMHSAATGMALGGHFVDLGRTPGNIGQNLAAQPTTILARLLLHPEAKLSWVYTLLNPFLLLLPLLNPLSLAALPDLLVFSFVALPADQYSVLWYFSLLITTVLYASTAYALNRFSARPLLTEFKTNLLNVIAVVMLCTNLAMLPLVFSPEMFKPDNGPWLATLQQIDASIGPNECVAPTVDIQEVFARRYELRRIGETTEGVPYQCKYVVVNQRYLDSLPATAPVQQLIPRLTTTEGYRLIRVENGISLYVHE